MNEYRKALEYFMEKLSDHNHDIDDLIITALEKQIPKSPNIWADGYYNGEPIYDMYDCPFCEDSYEIDYAKYDYCPLCGQKIDWSEYNEASI